MNKARTIYILLFAGIFSLCIFSFLFYQRIKILMTSYDLVNNATQAALQFDKLFLNLRDATVLSRDYLRQYDTVSYNDYFKKIKEYPATIDTLNALEQDNERQKEWLQHIKVLADSYINDMNYLMTFTEQKPPPQALTDTARVKLAKLRNEVRSVTDAELKILKQRDDELNKHIFTTPLFLLTFSLISLALIIYAFNQIIKQIKQNQSLLLNETRLRQSEERFRQLANVIPQIVWTARTDGYFDYYNKRWYEYTGFEEGYGDKSWIPILHPDDVQMCIDTWYESVKTGKPYQIEYRFKDRSNPGTYRWFLGKALPIKADDGTIIKWFGTCTDIQDQKNITKKLEQLVEERTTELTEKNKDLNEAQRLAHIGSWDWNIKANKVFWSDEMYRIYGVKQTDVANTFDTIISRIYDDDKMYAKQIFDEALVMRKPFDFYHRIKTTYGDVRTLHQRGKVYVDDEGIPSHVTGTAQDITENIEIQNHINELNETFNFAEQTSLIGSFRYNMSERMFSYSDNLYRILGCKPGEFEPKFENFITFVHHDDLERVLTEEKKLLSENISGEQFFRVVKKDGSIIHVRNTGIFITEDGERVYIGTLQDVTIQHNKELQLLDQNTTLEKMNKELASFSYVASHDLQEPLRKIKMYTKRLMEKEIDTLSNDSKEYFVRIENAAERMQQLIEDLLSYSSTNAKQSGFEITNINKLLDDVCDNLKEKIIQTNTIVEVDKLQPAKVIPYQFQQLFTNLITNSIKFTKPGVSPHIIVSHTYENGDLAKQFPSLQKGFYHHFKIKDNGIGFEPQYSEQIFGLFQRLHGRKEFEGTGIGLAICKKIAENHHGIITATSELNDGATFNIYIPVEQVDV